jgi:uncharacterized membrane-anchored protein YhcB (DUF1043 family)
MDFLKDHWLAVLLILWAGVFIGIVVAAFLTAARGN